MEGSITAYKIFNTSWFVKTCVSFLKSSQPSWRGFWRCTGHVEGCADVIHGYILYLYFLNFYLRVWSFEFVFLDVCICILCYTGHVEGWELVIHGSFTINNGTQWQNCPLHFFTIIVFANISTDPCFCFRIQRISALNPSLLMAFMLCYTLFLNH